jgi:type IX secretion system PorP/SprF family membrane protein
MPCGLKSKAMKKILLFILLLISCGVSAQYLPNNSQAFQFSPVLNPGFSGIENFGDFKLGYRYQWTGFGSYSPKFVNLGYSTQLRKPVDLAYNSLRTSTGNANRLNGIPRNRRIIHGLAVNLFQSKIGAIESLGGGVNFSLNYPLVNDLRLAVGMGAFLENRKLDMSEITVRDPDNDKFYQYLLTSSTSQTDFNLRAGFLFYNPKFYFGFSYLPLIYKSIQASDLALEEPFYKATIQGGINIQANPDLAFKPSVLALLQLDNSVALDLSVKSYIQDKVWFGLTYRTIKSGIAMLGLNLNEKFSVSYSYELSLGEFQQFSNGSHEVLLAIRFNNIKKHNQYTW